MVAPIRSAASRCSLHVCLLVAVFVSHTSSAQTAAQPLSAAEIASLEAAKT
jgi:hypothetical protein